MITVYNTLNCLFLEQFLFDFVFNLLKNLNFKISTFFKIYSQDFFGEEGN